MFVVSERWSNTYPDAMVGMLVARGAANVVEHPELERRKRMLEGALTGRFGNADDIKAAPAMQAYVSYYKRYEKTYHLVQQLKTLVVKQRPLPTVSGLVDVMFMAEMKNLLLTAGHDLTTVVPLIILDTGTGNESYIKLNQESQITKEDDMMVVDGVGILSTVIHGPDYRSRITPETRDALYVVYAPAGIAREEVIRHLRDIRENIMLFSPSVEVEPARLLSARGIEEVDV
jgi:DNA/RNA-binding domain of Phe-tRNA-synthetase-like protein